MSFLASPSFEQHIVVKVVREMGLVMVESSFSLLGLCADPFRFLCSFTDCALRSECGSGSS